MSFEELISRVSRKLKAIAYKLNGHFSFFNEEDLYQEALVHLWVDFTAGRLSDKTESYILQGCYFHLKNYIRKNYAKATLISLEAGADESGKGFNLDEVLFRGSPQSPFDLVNADLLTETINNNGLSKREKQVFNLALQGLTTREIGARLGISHVRVVKLKAQIKEKCGKYVE